MVLVRHISGKCPAMQYVTSCCLICLQVLYMKAVYALGIHVCMCEQKRSLSDCLSNAHFWYCSIAYSTLQSMILKKHALYGHNTFKTYSL